MKNVVPLLAAAALGGVAVFAAPYLAQAQGAPDGASWVFTPGRSASPSGSPHGWLLNSRTGALWYCVNEAPPVCVPVPKKP